MLDKYCQEEILTVLLNTSSIMVAIGFPLLIFLVSENRKTKEKLLDSVFTFNNEINHFRELISILHNVGLVRNFDQDLLKLNNSSEEERIKKTDEYRLFLAFKLISKDFENDLLNDNNINRRFSYNEIKKLRDASNRIWTAINCRKDLKRELREYRLNDLNAFDLERVKKLCKAFDSGDSDWKLDINLIGSISGEFEIKTSELERKVRRLEQPIPRIVKGLFLVLTANAVFGVLFPMILMFFSPIQSNVILATLVIISMICFIAMVYISGLFLFKQKLI